MIVPSGRNAGFSAVEAASVVPGRLCSSVVKTLGPLWPGTSTATISSLNFLAACAAEKRCCDRSAHWSYASRATWSSRTRSSMPTRGLRTLAAKNATSNHRSLSYDQTRMAKKARELVRKISRDACAPVKCANRAAILTIEWLDRGQCHARTLYRNHARRE